MRTLDVGLVGAAGGQLLLEAAELLQTRHPGCEVLVREVQLVDALPWLLNGEVEVLLTCFLGERDDLVAGPMLVTEARMLAVPSGHPLADGRSGSVQDLAGATVLRTPDDLPSSPPPRQTPTGRPIESGPAAGSFQEIPDPRRCRPRTLPDRRPHEALLRAPRCRLRPLPRCSAGPLAPDLAYGR